VAARVVCTDAIAVAEFMAIRVINVDVIEFIAAKSSGVICVVAFTGAGTAFASDADAGVAAWVVRMDTVAMAESMAAETSGIECEVAVADAAVTKAGVLHRAVLGTAGGGGRIFAAIVAVVMNGADWCKNVL